MFHRLTVVALLGASVALVAPHAGAASLFSNFTPIPASVAGGSLPESAPFQLGNAAWTQTSLANRQAQLAAGEFNSGKWDMNTVNETGPEAGRYLFQPFESGQAGIQRIDLTTGQAVTIWNSPNPGDHRSFDASRWTPWGSYLTAEERWSDPGQPPIQHGRLYEVKNPLAAPADIQIKHADILPRVSHEGLAFDKDGALYFIDERNGSHIFKYVSATPGADTYFDKGQSFVLRVNDGMTDRDTGASQWIALTDADGAPLPNTVTGVDPNGIPFLDGRATPNIAEFLGTNYNRPEDLEVKTLADGSQLLFVATTTDDEVYALNLKTNQMMRFADRSTIDKATGLPVGEVFNNPDNLAIDADGNIYIVEDQPGGKADIWYAKDENNDGVADWVARWATLSTLGAEPTGLYFDPFNENRAFVNVQHPSSQDDRTIMIEAYAATAPVPLPAPALLLGASVVALAGLRRARKA